VGADFDHRDSALPLQSHLAGPAALCGNGIGSSLGAVIASYFEPNWLVDGSGMVVCGIFGAKLRLEAAYRFAAITLSIIWLVSHEHRPGSWLLTAS